MFTIFLYNGACRHFCSLSSVPCLFVLLSSNGGGKGGNAQPLVSWSEVPGHTGLLYCMAQATNNPIVLMIKPDVIMVQEIKVLPSKAKVRDHECSLFDL